MMPCAEKQKTDSGVLYGRMSPFRYEGKIAVGTLFSTLATINNPTLNTCDYHNMILGKH